MLDKQTVDALKATYGEDLCVAEGPTVDLVFRKPSRAVWERYQNKNGNDRADKSAALRELCLACLVYPGSEERGPDYQALRDAFEEMPGLPLTIMGELAAMAGLREDLVKKL